MWAKVSLVGEAALELTLETCVEDFLEACLEVLLELRLDEKELAMSFRFLRSLSISMTCICMLCSIFIMNL